MRFSKRPEARRGEDGAVLAEFAAAFVIFWLFAAGLTAISLWGIGGAIAQEAAFEAAHTYAVEADAGRAAAAARARVGRWAYVFLDPATLEVRVWREGDRAAAEVTARPRLASLGPVKAPAIRRFASCSMEYRFRRPWEFEGT